MNSNEVNEMSWQDFEKPESYFVNDKVTKYGVIKVNSKWSGLLSNTRKSLTLFIPFFLLLAVTAVVMLITNFFIGIAFLLAGLVLYGLFINRFVFHAKRTSKLLADQRRIGRYGVSRWNDVVVDKETGQIFNTTGGLRGVRSSFIVTWDDAPILDNSMEAEQLVVDRELAPFITELGAMHMKFIKRNIEIRNDISPALMNTIVNTRKSQNEAVKIKMELQNKVYSAIELKSQQRYQNAIQVIIDARAKLFDFRGSLQSILDSTLSTSKILKNVHIMDYDEVQEFARNESHDFTLDLAQTGRNNDAMSVFRYLDILSIVDDHGREYNYSDIVRAGEPMLNDLEFDNQKIPERRVRNNNNLDRDKIAKRKTFSERNKIRNNNKNNRQKDRKIDKRISQSGVDWRNDDHFLEDL